MNEAEAQNLLKEFRYDNQNDVNMRLKGTVLRYRGRPVYCLGSFEDLRIQLEDIGDYGKNGPPFIVHSSDADLDISSVPLGWANFEGYCLYLMRSARNSQRQGVNPGSLIYYDPAPRGDRSMARFVFNNHSDLYAIGACILGDYPSFKSLMGLKNGGAFHQEWAIVNPHPSSQKRYYTVFHKTTPVASFDSKTGRFLFRRLRLTKTRKASLMDALNTPANIKEGITYEIAEQK